MTNLSDSDEVILIHGPKVNSPKNAQSVGEYFYQRLEAGGDQIAQIIEDDGDGEEGVLRFSDILHAGKVVAGLLRTHGLGSQDAVLAVTGNTLEHAPIFWGTQFVGATIVSVDPLHEIDNMLHFLQTIRPKAVFCNELAEPKVRSAMAQFDDKDLVLITIDETLEYLKEHPSEEGFHLGRVGDPDTDVATALFTSCTSGTPKCVEITHSAIMRMLDMKHLPGVNTKDQQVCVNMAGPHGVSGLVTNLQATNANTTCLLVPQETFDAAGFMEVLVKYKVNFLALSPRHLVSMLKCPEAGKFDLSQVKACLVGGAPVCDTMRKLAKAKLKIDVTPEYILTEVFGVFSPAYGVTNRPGTVGKLADNIVAKIVDVDSGKSLGPGEQGELRVKTAHRTPRYRNDPEATAASLDKDGFLKTGDLGFYDEEEFFYVLGRITEVIRHSGELVAAVDIEAVLLRHIKVQEVCVIGVYHELEDELATAIVVLKKDETVSEEELVILVKNILPGTKWVHGGVHFVDFLPCALDARIDRRSLKDAYNRQRGCKVTVPLYVNDSLSRSIFSN